MIPLMKNSFLEEFKTKKELAEYIIQTSVFSMGEQCLLFEKRLSKRLFL